MFCLKRGAFASDSSTHIRILGLMKPFPLTCNMCDNVWNILFLNFRLFWVVLTNLMFFIKSRSVELTSYYYKFKSKHFCVYAILKNILSKTTNFSIVSIFSSKNIFLSNLNYIGG